MTNPEPVVVLGGGVAGLAAGFYARRRGRSVRILEASPDLGGNARTLQHGPFGFDTGAHRFHDRYADVTADVRALLGPDLVEVRAPSQIYWNGAFVDFPLTPFNLMRGLGPRLSVRAVADLVAGRLARREGSASFGAWAVHAYGRTIADRFLLGYSQKLWGVSCEHLSPSVAGRRLQGLSLGLLVRELWGRSRPEAPHLDGRFFYPTHGIGMIADRLAAACGREHISVRSRVTRIHHDGARLNWIEVNGRERVEVTTSQVVSTLPLGLMTGLLRPPPPDSVLAAARSLRFRHVVLVMLFLDQPSVSQNATIYFPEPSCVFTRVSEPRNRSPLLAPPGRTSLSVEIPCWTQDEVWTLPDDRLIARCHETLRAAGLLRGGAVEGRVHRIRCAYPVLELGIERRIGEVRDHLARFGNLYMAGRSGLFTYTHLHDLLREGRELIDDITRFACSNRTGPWNVPVLGTDCEPNDA